MYSKLLVAALLAAAATSTEGSCANDCSGQGLCNVNSQCECYRNWMGNDCSRRVCYFGRAFVDTQKGDLNSNGMIDTDLVASRSANTKVSEGFPAGFGDGFAGLFTSSSVWSEAHFYAECSNKGTCNRESGLCECWPGYEGSGCTRLACPSSTDNMCSGHGTCDTMTNLDTEYKGWDADKTQRCVCDAGYTGIGCANRICMSGDDPITKYVKLTTVCMKLTSLTGDNRPIDDLATLQSGSATIIGGLSGATGRVAQAAGHTLAGASVLHTVASGCMDFVDVVGEFVVGEKLYVKTSGEPLVTATTPKEALWIASIDLATYTQTSQVKEIQTLVFTPAQGHNGVSAAAWTPFALTFTDEMGQKYTTRTIAQALDDTMSLQGLMDDIESAIEALPNAAVPDVQLFVGSFPVAGDFSTLCDDSSTVPASDITLAFENDATCNGGAFDDLTLKAEGSNCVSGTGTVVERTLQNEKPACAVKAGGTNSACAAATTAAECTAGTTNSATNSADPVINACEFAGKSCDYFAIDIHFVGNSGDVPKFEIYNGADCGGIAACVSSAVPYPAFYEVTVNVHTAGTTENSLCSSRGTCDYTTGDCKCFQGFTGVDCSRQNVLAMY